MIAYFCDFCKKETLDKKLYVLPREEKGYYSYGKIEVHLCNECKSKLIPVINDLMKLNKERFC